ncbi:hypothetical protein Tco_1170877 [Tanacetum coccineum]
MRAVWKVNVMRDDVWENEYALMAGMKTPRINREGIRNGGRRDMPNTRGSVHGRSGNFGTCRRVIGESGDGRCRKCGVMIDCEDLEDVGITVNRGDGDVSEEDECDNTERHEDYDSDDIDDAETSYPFFSCTF